LSVRALRYEGYEALDETPHVMVDGSARQASPFICPARDARQRRR